MDVIYSLIDIGKVLYKMATLNYTYRNSYVMKYISQYSAKQKECKK